MSNNRRFRRIVNVLHLWIGIPCGLILFVVCLSGTIYVFNREIVQWIDADKYKLTVPQDHQPLPLQQLILLVERERPGFETVIVGVPQEKDKAWTFTLRPRKPAGMATDKNTARQQQKVWLTDPYTGRVIGDAQTTSFQFFNTVMQIHRWLLMDHDIGKVVTGIAAILFLIMEISGLILWFPARIRSWRNWAAWKPVLVIKTAGSWKRTNHDLHRALGFYSFLVLTIIAITGSAMAFDWYKTGLSRLLGVQQGTKAAKPMKHSPSHDGLNTPVLALINSPAPLYTPGLDSLYGIATTSLPYAGDLRINLPTGHSDTVSFLKSRTAFWASAGVDRLMISRQTGQIYKTELFANKTLGAKIISSIKLIHTGEMFGILSKIIWFIACLVATSLPITGTLIWVNKFRKSGKRSSILTSDTTK